MSVLDPTRTKMLRLQYARQLRRLYKRFGRLQVPKILAYVEQQLNKYGIAFGDAWVTRKTVEKIRLAQELDRYLDITIQKEILEPSESIIRNNIKMAYLKGRDKAKTVLDNYDMDLLENMTPLDWQALHELQNINFNRIKDCTNVMRDAITYNCSKGVMSGWGIDKIAREIRKSINGNQTMGIYRAKMIARTEVINAYTKASDNMYKSVGLTEKEIVVLAASDCCDICDGYDGKPVGEVGYPTFHPNCRCTIIAKPEK